MAETYRVIITAEALADLEGIAEYIRRHSPQNAATVADTLLSAIDSLSFMPARFKRVGTSRKKRSPVHAMVVRPFIIHYRVDERPPAAFILHVFHGARRQPRRFE